MVTARRCETQVSLSSIFLKDKNMLCIMWCIKKVKFCDIYQCSKVDFRSFYPWLNWGLRFWVCLSILLWWIILLQKDWLRTLMKDGWLKRVKRNFLLALGTDVQNLNARSRASYTSEIYIPWRIPNIIKVQGVVGHSTSRKNKTKKGAGRKEFVKTIQRRSVATSQKSEWTLLKI